MAWLAGMLKLLLLLEDATGVKRSPPSPRSAEGASSTAVGTRRLATTLPFRLLIRMRRLAVVEAEEVLLESCTLTSCRSWYPGC